MDRKEAADRIKCLIEDGFDTGRKLYPFDEKDTEALSMAMIVLGEPEKANLQDIIEEIEMEKKREVGGNYNKMEHAWYLNGLNETIEIIRDAMNEPEKMHGGWILCSDRLPYKEECGDYGCDFQVTVNNPNPKTLTMTFVFEVVRGKEVGRWKWMGSLSQWEVIAWKPLSEPCRCRREQ